MEKTRIHKEDVEYLDLLIKTCLGPKMASIDILPDISDDAFIKSIADDKRDYYQRLFNIIEEYDVAEVMESTKSLPFVNEIAVVTKRFYDNGGFKNELKVQEHKEKLQKIREQKEIREATIIKWHMKTYWITIGIAIAGFIIAVISVFLQFY